MPLLALAPESAGRTSAPRALRVLVVEDDDSSREPLAALCRHVGHTCVEVATRAAALAELVRQPPDAVLLDLMLPDGNGVEVLRLVRHQRWAIRVAVVTASDPSVLEEVQRLQPDALFRKPVDFADLRAWLG